jgi:sterol 3beta-glucosyltransferase
MRVAILTFGTRGDAQPYAVLGDHLRRRGHDVRLTVASNLVGMIEQAGLPATAIPIDSQEFMSSREGREILSAGRTTLFLRELGKRETAARAGIDDAILEACEGADVVIASVLLVARAWQVTQHTRQRLMPVFTMPLLPTVDYPSPFLARGHLPSGALRRGSHHAFEHVYWLGARANTRSTRRRLGLRGSGANPLRSLRGAGIPVQHLVAPAVLDPSDWPSTASCIGAPAVPSHLRAAWGDDAASPELEAWLSEGEAPVYFGFGSMPVLEPGLALQRILDVADALGVRALIGAGWSDVPRGRTAGGRAYVVAAFDHDAVLPRCRAAVHHGGAGTTHAALRAGLPAVVAHVFADQLLWARLIERRGWGAALPYQRLTAASLIERLRPLLTPEARGRVAAAARAVAADDATGAVTTLLESAA